MLIALLFPYMKYFCRYAIKIEIRPRPVSIFSDPVLSGRFVNSRVWSIYKGSTVLQFTSY